LDKRVLLAYASKCGSTGEIAQAIGKRLGEAGVAVDVIPVKTVKSLDGYDAVVLGSAIRVGQWLPEATAFLKSRQAELSRLPVAIFTVHLQATDESEESRQKREAYTAPLQPLVSPKARAFFAGKMDFSKLSLLERMATKMVKAPEEDRRDWNAIDAWAAKLPEALLPGGG